MRWHYGIQQWRIRMYFMRIGAGLIWINLPQIQSLEWKFMWSLIQLQNFFVDAQPKEVSRQIRERAKFVWACLVQSQSSIKKQLIMASCLGWRSTALLVGNLFFQGKVIFILIWQK